MKSCNDITRIGSFALCLAVMAVASPSVLAFEGVMENLEIGFHQPSTFDIIKVAQLSGRHQRVQQHSMSQSVQVIPRRNLKPVSHTRGALNQRRSRPVVPLLFYPMNWGYDGGITEEVLEEYLEEFYDRQKMALEEEPIISPPKPAPLPLIIEEQCGKYVRIPWPDSGVLFEPVEEPTCPKSD